MTAKIHQTVKRASLLAMIFVTLNAFMATKLLAKSGQQYYLSGDCKRAIPQFKKELKSARTKIKKANLEKMIGICHYNNGTSGQAEYHFRKAISLNPSIKLSTKEVLDSSVISFFKRVKIKNTRRSVPKRTAPTPTARTAPKPRTTPGAQTSTISPSETKLLVKANVKGQVLTEGIMIGSTGTVLSVDPGRVTLTVVASGYRDISLNSTLKRGSLNTLNVTLKPKARTKLKPKKKIAQRRAPKKRKATRTGSRRKRAGGALFADEPPLDYGPVRKKRRRRPARYVAPPQSPYGGYRQPQQPYGYTQPQQQPYGYGQPQQPYGVVGQNPYAPPPQPGYAPPAPQPPAYDPYAAPPEPPPESFTRKRKKRRPRAKKGSTFVNLLPLGAGQYQNGSHLLGAFFTVSQAGAVIYGVMQYQAADKSIEDFETQVQVAMQNAPTDAAEKEQFDADLVKQQQIANEYADSLRQQGLIAFGVGGALWVASAVEAMSYKPKAKKKRRKGSPFGSLLKQETRIAYDAVSYRSSKSSFQYGAVPMQKSLLGVGAGIKFEF